MDEMTTMFEGMRTRIFDLLKEQKISQRELAEKLQILPQTITDWKKGNSNSFTRYKDQIAEMLHTTSRWLLTGEGIKYVPDEQREEVLLQEIKGANLRIHRHSLNIMIDSLPDDKLENLSGELIEMLTKLNPEDMDLLYGIVRLMIARGK